MNKLELLTKQIQELRPEDRATLDSSLLGMIGQDAEAQRSQYEFVLASDYLEEARELRLNWGRMQGISSGYKSIDQLTLGFVPGEITVVAGPTSNGKTALAVNMTARMIQQGMTVLFVTLEMTRPQLTSRMMYAVDDFEDFAAQLAFQKVDELNWRSIDGLIASAVRQLDIQIVVIDHLHYFSRELDRLAEDIGRITKELKKNAMRHKIPIILISHVRKTGKGEMATMEDLRGSSYIAQDADIVLMVNRKTQYPNQIAIVCEKNRNRGIAGDGATGLHWYKTKITEDTDHGTYQFNH